MMFEYGKTGGKAGDLKLWWHSHAKDRVFWSNVDDATPAKFKNNFMLSLVTNKHSEYLCRIDVFSPFRMTVDHLPFRLWVERDTELEAEIEREVKEKVKIVHKTKEEMAAIFNPKQDQESKK